MLIFKSANVYQVKMIFRMTRFEKSMADSRDGGSCKRLDAQRIIPPNLVRICPTIKIIFSPKSL